MRARFTRWMRWALALAALAFVAWVVPVRDRCWDPRAPATTRVAVTHSGTDCVLHLRTGEVVLPADECAALTCEPGLASTSAHANAPVILGLLVLYGLGYLAWAARWQALLGFAGVDMTLAQVWRVSIEAQAGGVLLPGGIGGDALRIASVVARPTRAGEVRAPTAIVVASVLLDRAIGLSVIAALAAVLGIGFGGVRDAGLAFLLAGIPLGALAGLWILRIVPMERLAWLRKGRLAGIVTPVLEYLRHPRAPRAIAVAVALSVVVAAVQLGCIRGIVLALGGAPTAEKWVYVGSAMSFIVAAIPALPGAWGTADASWVFFLGLAGLSAGTALGVSLVYRLFWYISAILGAILNVTRARSATPPAVPEDPPPA